MFRPSFATPLCALFSLFFLSGAAFAATIQATLTPTAKPLELPPVLVENLNGQKETLASLVRGKAAHGVLLLHFWAPDCAPCVPEMKELDAAWMALRTKGLMVVTIAEDHNGVITVPAFKRRHGLQNADVVIDQSRIAATYLQAPGIPVTYLVSQTGMITAMHAGAIDWTTLEP